MTCIVCDAYEEGDATLLLCSRCTQEAVNAPGLLYLRCKELGLIEAMKYLRRSGVLYGNISEEK